MKRIFSFILSLLTVPVFAQQVTTADIKKHRIRKITETTAGQYGTTSRFWIYDRKGYDSLQSNSDDTSTFYYTFKKGKLAEKRVALSQKPDRDHVDTYTYAYSADGSYTITYRDGAFGMKSYEWYDAKGRMTRSQSPDGNTTSYKYNAAGKLLSVVSDGKNNGIKVNHKYSYNSKGLLAKKESNTDGNKSEVNYLYDAKGRLVKETQKGGWEGEESETVSTFEYNEKGLLKKIITQQGEEVTTITYKYEYHK